MSTAEIIAKGKRRARRRNRAVRQTLGEAMQGLALGAHVRTNSHRGSSDFNMRSYEPVESIARALRVLRTVSEFEIVTIGDIFAETKIPKSTIVRVLETLISEGYIARDNLCGGYRITSKSNDLGAGQSGIARTIEIARPIIVDLTNKKQWPVSIGTFDGDAVWVRFSTAALCKRANAVSLGWRLDLFYSAMGRAYLAFCSAAERERIFKAKVNDGLLTRADETKLRALLPQIREKGFAVRGENRTVAPSSVAVPIFSKSTLLGVMNLSYLKDAVAPEAFEAEIADPLLAAKAQIEAQIQHQQQLSSRPKTSKAPVGASAVTPIKLEENLSRVVV
jgi:IclR family mhp operon transcriptional activator